MGPQTEGAVLDPLLVIPEAAAAVFSQSIQGAIAEQAAELLWIRAWMAGKILTFLILEKIIMTHIASSFLLIKKAPGIDFRRLVVKLHPYSGDWVPEADFLGIQRDLAGVVQA